MSGHRSAVPSHETLPRTLTIGNWKLSSWRRGETRFAESRGGSERLVSRWELFGHFVVRMWRSVAGRARSSSAGPSLPGFVAPARANLPDGPSGLRSFGFSSYTFHWMQIDRGRLRKTGAAVLHLRCTSIACSVCGPALAHFFFVKLHDHLLKDLDHLVGVGFVLGSLSENAPVFGGVFVFSIRIICGGKIFHQLLHGHDGNLFEVRFNLLHGILAYFIKR